MVTIYLYSQKNGNSLRFRIDKEIVDRFKMKKDKVYKIELLGEIEGGEIPKIKND